MLLAQTFTYSLTFQDYLEDVSKFYFLVQYDAISPNVQKLLALV